MPSKTGNRNGSRNISHGSTSPLPGFEYDVKGTFLSVEERGVKFSKQGKGVLDQLRLRRPQNDAKGDIALRFLSSYTIPTHSDILHKSDVHTQPVLDVSFGGMPFSIAARYTVRPGRRGPVEIGMMIDGALPGDVRDQQGYEQALYVASLAVGIAVLQGAKEADSNTAGMELVVSNNFASSGTPDLVEITGTNIAELQKKLSV